MSIKGQGHSLTLVKGHSDFKVKCLSFGLYTQVKVSGPLGPLVVNTKNISSHLLKISAISLVLHTREITDVFNTYDEIYLVFT